LHFREEKDMKVLLLVATALGLAAVLLVFTISAPAAQTAASVPGAPLGPADTYFVTQTSLGTPFQVDSGRLAETKGTTQAIRGYAELMVSSHIAVNNALLGILKNKAPVPPPTLLKAAYATMVSTLQHETGPALDVDYVRGQVNYQKANTALYQYEIANGTDPDLKAFAQETLPKIQDHLARALKLQGVAD
jgi:putative membrane protein